MAGQVFQGCIEPSWMAAGPKGEQLACGVRVRSSLSPHKHSSITLFASSTAFLAAPQDFTSRSERAYLEHKVWDDAVKPAHKA